MIRWLFDRWQTKLLALLLAVVLFSFTGTRIVTTRSLVVDLGSEHVSGLPIDDWVVTDIVPDELDLHLSGPDRILQALEPRDLRPDLAISAAGLQQGWQSFDVTEGLLDLNPNLRLDRSSGQSIVVRFARRIERTVPIQERPPIEGLAEGLRVDFTLDRSHLAIVGPEAAVTAIVTAGRIPVLPIDLSDIPADLSQTVTRTLSLAPDLPPGVTTVGTGERAVASLVIGPETDTRTNVTLPLVVLAPPGLLSGRGVEVPEKVVVSLTGPRNRLSELDPGSLRAYVDLSSVEVYGQPFDRGVGVIGPPWLKPTATQVRVTVSDRVADASGSQTPGNDALPPPDPVEPPPPALGPGLPAPPPPE